MVLEKRALLASGELRTATSHQGTPALECPTVQERAALLRVLYIDRSDQPAEPWPTHQDQALMAMVRFSIDSPVSTKLQFAWYYRRRHGLTPTLFFQLFPMVSHWFPIDN